mmetsp:Transcript_42414/g.83622  ORF Transcript_42414/g.83622 Transcript_42414/m.83622 type:complete len:209 (+) Transcript_42414:795-1421(+)
MLSHGRHPAACELPSLPNFLLRLLQLRNRRLHLFRCQEKFSSFSFSPLHLIVHVEKRVPKPGSSKGAQERLSEETVKKTCLLECLEDSDKFQVVFVWNTRPLRIPRFLKCGPKHAPLRVGIRTPRPASLSLLHLRGCCLWDRFWFLLPFPFASFYSLHTTDISVSSSSFFRMFIIQIPETAVCTYPAHQPTKNLSLKVLHRHNPPLQR